MPLLLPQKRDNPRGDETPDSKASRTVFGLQVCQVADLPVLSDPEATIACLAPELAEEELGTVKGARRARGGRDATHRAPMKLRGEEGGRTSRAL